MSKSSRMKNAPSTTGKPSGGGRGNNPPRTMGGSGSSNGSLGSKSSSKK